MSMRQVVCGGHGNAPRSTANLWGRASHGSHSEAAPERNVTGWTHAACVPHPPYRHDAAVALALPQQHPSPLAASPAVLRAHVVALPVQRGGVHFLQAGNMAGVATSRGQVHCRRSLPLSDGQQG